MQNSNESTLKIRLWGYIKEKGTKIIVLIKLQEIYKKNITTRKRPNIFQFLKFEV